MIFYNSVSGRYVIRLTYVFICEFSFHNKRLNYLKNLSSVMVSNRILFKVTRLGYLGSFESFKFSPLSDLPLAKIYNSFLYKGK